MSAWIWVIATGGSIAGTGIAEMVKANWPVRDMLRQRRIAKTRAAEARDLDCLADDMECHHPDVVEIEATFRKISEAAS